MVRCAWSRSRLVPWVLVACAAFWLPCPSPAGEVGFVEDFALSADRGSALEQLVPGTDDYYYYYQALHWQNTGELRRIPDLLRAWTERHGRNERVLEIENRQLLLGYPSDPKGSLDGLRARLGLAFNHERQAQGEPPRLPSALDPALVSREAYWARFVEARPDRVDSLTDDSLEWALGRKLTPEQRRGILARLERPDVSGLARAVVDDLRTKGSRGFGSLSIHKALLLEQLDECLRLLPELRDNPEMVRTYIRRLWPSADVDVRDNPKEREAFLGRLEAFVSKLSPAQNSLKAHVAYHRLAHDLALGVPDRGRFLQYLALPRNTGYALREHLARPENRNVGADLGADYRSVTGMPPIANDEALVRAYLERFLQTEADARAYAPYIEEGWLRRVFAETKLLYGIGDAERWHQLLTPGELQSLRDRVEVEFTPTRKERFGVDEQVGLDVDLKNVGSLLVKVFELNAFNYYKENQKEVDVTVDLDGLIPSEEKTIEVPEPPIRRVSRRLEFPGLARRGVFVIELVGNGRSSRALVRKGDFEVLETFTGAGHAITVLDEGHKRVPDARVWMGGQEYKPTAEGFFFLPFTSTPGVTQLVVTKGDFASLETIQHRPERYELSVGMHAEREALLSGKTASVVVRPVLLLDGKPVTVTLIEDPSLVITVQTRDGTASALEVKPFALHDDAESVHEFPVPAQLASISFTLRGRVQQASTGQKVDLNASSGFSLNGIDATESTESLLLVRSSGGFALDLLGKNGEPRPQRAVQLALRRRGFQEPIHVSLATDRRGRISLGTLEGIDGIAGAGPEGTSQAWQLEDRVWAELPAAAQGKAGKPILLPQVGADATPLREELSLLELRGGEYARDWFSALRVDDGLLSADDLPAGDYRLYSKRLHRAVEVRVAAGEEAEGYVHSPARRLETSGAAPLAIRSAEVAGDVVRVRLANSTAMTRVHVAAVRYEPEQTLHGSLDVVPLPVPRLEDTSPPRSLYVTGRDIGEELRYILERRLAKKFPGNLLVRPSLLLSPWVVASTQTATRDVAAGTDYTVTAEMANDLARRGARPVSLALRDAGGGGGATSGGFPNLDFLASPAVVLANLRAGPDGALDIPVSKLGGRQEVWVVALSPEGAAARCVLLDEPSLAARDVRLMAGLNPRVHATQKKEVTFLDKAASITFEDITTSQLEAYDSLAAVHALFMTLSGGDAALREFAFLLKWPDLKPQEQLDEYSKHECHELNYFLYRKDPAFFEAVVKPYIANKLEKTFVDHWLLGDDLGDYRRAWAFDQLNAFEQALLAQRVAEEGDLVPSRLKDILETIPPDIGTFERRFQTALLGRALDAGDELGVVEAQEKAKKVMFAYEGKAAAAESAAPAAAPPAPGAGLLRQRAGEDRKSKDEALSEAAEGESSGADKQQNAAANRAFGLGGQAGRGLAIRQMREQLKRLYQKLEATQEWAESHYYHVGLAARGPGLVPPSDFWLDFARHRGQGPFVSLHFLEAARSSTEMLLALAVLDLPFKAGQHVTSLDGTSYKLQAASALLLVHQQIRPAELSGEKAPILVTQNFYRRGERHRTESGREVDNYVTGELQTLVVYGCQVVITNPTSTQQRLEVLIQVPQGSLPVVSGKPTRSLTILLEPYHTWTDDYFFYFPAPGSFVQFPVHVSQSEKVLAFGEAPVLKVVDTPSRLDLASWEHVSQDGTGAEVLAFLRDRNLQAVPLERMAWRLKEKRLFLDVIKALEGRHRYDDTTWSYGIYHDEPRVAQEYLRHQDEFVAHCGKFLRTPLLVIDTRERRAAEHLEYWPLVNARAHRLGKAREILNDRFFAQYTRLLAELCYKPALDAEDLLVTTTYLVLQDRTAAALETFRRIRSAEIASRLQYDYLDTYLAFSAGDTRRARDNTARYASFPVERWRSLFATASSQLDEIEGKAPATPKPEDRDQVQSALAAEAPSLELEVKGEEVVLRHHNVRDVTVSYYLMDIELLFSKSPFLGDYTGGFSYIRPNGVEQLALEPAGGARVFKIPERYASQNVYIEARGGGARATGTHYSGAMGVQISESYAQARVTDAQTGKPIPEVYIKVYSRRNDGSVQFYKDGYTDLRGRFDYGSLSTNEIEDTSRFAILLLSPERGALVREAAPPKR